MDYQDYHAPQPNSARSSRTEAYRQFFTPMTPARNDNSDFDTSDYRFRGRSERYSSEYVLSSVLQ